MKIKFGNAIFEINKKNDVKKIMLLFKREREFAIEINKVMYGTEYYIERAVDYMINILNDVLLNYKNDQYSESILEEIKSYILNHQSYYYLNSYLDRCLVPGTTKYNIVKGVYEDFNGDVKKETLEKALNYSEDMQLYNYLSQKYYEDEKIIKFIDTKKEDFIEIDQIAKSAKEIANEALQLTNELIEKADRDFARKMKSLEEKYDERYSNIEDSHKAKLNYTVPSERWEKNSKRYMKLFNDSLVGTVTAAIVVVLIFFFYFVPLLLDLKLSNQEHYFKFIGTTGAVVSIVSIIFYNLFKLTFSFYNLAQDSVERGELIQTYYALQGDGRATTGSAEEIILTAIFARSDSGLLKSQDTIIPDIFKNKK